MKGGPERFTYGIAEEPEAIDQLNLETSVGEVPMNFDFVHISNPADEDEELVKIENSEKIPLNFRFWNSMMMPRRHFLNPYLSENTKCSL